MGRLVAVIAALPESGFVRGGRSVGRDGHPTVGQVTVLKARARGL